MPARSEDFPWPSHYGHFNYFEDRMTGHSKVRALQRLDSGLYKVALSDSREIITFICECYSYGVAEYAETVAKLGKIDAVVINSNWCGYTGDLNAQCRDEGVGLFNIKDFMGALNQKDFWLYVSREEKEEMKRRGAL